MSEDKGIRTVRFSGKKEDFYMWQRKFMSLATYKKYEKVLKGDMKVIVFLSLAYLWMLNILLNICLCEFAVRTNLIIMGNKDNSKAANWKTLALNSQDCNILFHVSFSKEDYHNHNICSMFLLLHIIIQTTLTFEIPFKLCSECTFYHFICTTS